MSKVVDDQVARLKGKVEPIGEMTHWERMTAASDLKPTDMVPVAPELDYWLITHAGYTHREIYDDVDKTADACIRTWADLRTDAIWMYVDISHQIEHFIPPEKRPEHFIHRGDQDYLLFKPLVETLDEVQWFLKWMVTELEENVKHYLDRCLEERLAALDFYADFAAKNGAAFCCASDGARVWEPRHLEKFDDADRIWVEKARKIFPYLFWHTCGHNLPNALQMVSEWEGIKAIQYDMPYYGQQVTWPEWFESVARMLKGKQCAANAPTTQLACHGTPEQVATMVRQFIEATTPHTTACVMPGCEVDAFNPELNVRAMIDAARAKPLQ